MPSSTTSSRRRGWGSSSYSELEETLVVVPLRTATLLFNEHFSTPLQQLRYPVHLDFSHDRFKLRSLSLLSQLKETALQEIDLTGNDMASLEELNRFASLKSIVAARNLLKASSSVNLAVHRLTRLDVSDNRLSSVPPLKELPLLQVLNVSHNRIREGWGELTHCVGLQALDASHNQLSWDQVRGCLCTRCVVA